jgi:IstB-like ATP binding protein
VAHEPFRLPNLRGRAGTHFRRCETRASVDRCVFRLNALTDASRYTALLVPMGAKGAPRPSPRAGKPRFESQAGFVYPDGCFRSYRGFFVRAPVAQVVERLLEAKKNLRLARELKRLDNFECIALDDIGYVQHDRTEMEVLFALLAERYERKSVMITSNLVFSKWDQIFKDPMTTAAAIDRVVHHAVVLEFLGPSLRSEVAEERARAASTKRNPAPPADE